MAHLCQYCLKLQQGLPPEARLLETRGQRICGNCTTMADGFQELPPNATIEERDEGDKEEEDREENSDSKKDTDSEDEEDISDWDSDYKNPWETLCQDFKESLSQCYEKTSRQVLERGGIWSGGWGQGFQCSITRLQGRVAKALLTLSSLVWTSKTQPCT